MNKRVKIGGPVATIPKADKPKTSAPEYSVVEPRIMLDANLSWTIDASDSLTDALQGVTKMLDADFGAFDTFVDNFETTLDALAPVLDVALSEEDSALDLLSKTVAALRESADALKAGADDILDAVVTASFHTILESQMDSWVDATSTGTTTQKNNLKAQITLAQMQANFGQDDFRAATISANVDSFVGSLAANLALNGLSQAAAKTHLLTLIEAGLGGSADKTLEFTLADATLDGIAIAYADGTNTDEVDVEIDLPGLDLDLNALFGAAFDNATLPMDFAALGVDTRLGFTLKTTVSAAAVGINAIDFDLDNLVAFGGDLVPGGASLNLGLLEMSVTTAETAQISLGIGTDAAMTLRTEAALTSGFAVTTSTTAGALTGNLMINEAGGADTFVAVAVDTSYAMLTLGLQGTTAFVTGVGDTDNSDNAKFFTASLTVSGVVKSSTAATPKDRIAAFLASADAGFDIDLSSSVTDASQRAGMELALENLAVLGAEEIFQFIADIGAATQGILTDAAMDVSVPFTDINLNVAAQAIAEVFASLPSSFLIDPAQLGFDTGAPGALVEVEASFTQSGAAMTSAQMQALKTFGVMEFRIATGGTPAHVAVNIDLTDNAVMLNSAATDAQLMAELVRLLNVAIKAYGMAASFASNVLTFNARYPGNDPANPLPALSLVGVRERGASNSDRSDDVANDTISLTDFGFAAGNLTDDADGLSTGGDDALGGGAETIVKFVQSGGIEAIIGPSFALDTQGRDRITLEVTVGSSTNTVEVMEPAGGWLLADGTPDLDSLLTSLNTALSSASAVAAINFDRTGFVVGSTISGETVSLQVEPLAALTSPISSALNERTAAELAPEDIAALKTYASLDLRVLTGTLDANGDAVVAAVTVDLATGVANTVLSDPAATDAQILDAVALAMDTALDAYGIDVTVVNGAFRVTSAFPGGPTTTPPTFGIIGADNRIGGAFDDSFSLESLGFGGSALEEPVDYDLSTTAGDGGDGSEYVLSFFGTSTQTLVFGPLFAETMIGVSELLFTVSVGGEDHALLIEKPAGDWVLAGNAPNYADIAAVFNAAFADAGFALQATMISGGGLSFTVPAGTDQLYTFGVEPGKLVRALSIDGLFDWVNVELNKVEVLEGSKLMLSEDGELLFQFPEITRSATIASSSQLSGLQLEELGFGQLENVDLSANLNATITASLDMVAGLDLVELGLGLVDETREDIGDLVFENTFLRDVDFVVDLTGKATDVTGSADMGLLKVEIGATDASKNFLALNVQLNVGVVGEDASGNKTTDLSMANVEAAFTAGRVSDLIGRYDLQGGILTENGANAYDTMGERATIDTLQILDPANDVPGPDEALVMFYATLGDIRLDVGTLTGLNEDLVDGINIAIGDGLDPLNTFDIAIYSNDPAAQEAIDGLSAMEEGDILDTLSAIGHTLQVVGEKLKDDLPFLDEDLPLFNFSLLDGVDFATEFVDKLREVRDNPQATLDKIEEFLESIFGADTIELEWLPVEKTITIEMEFGFLRDYQEELPLSLDLDQLLAGNFSGEGIDAEVAELISGIADVSGSGTLVFDPDLTLRMKFGIDLRPTLDPSTVIAAPELELFQLVSGSVVSQNTSGDDDIEIVWTDETNPAAVVNKTIRVDLDGLNTVAEIVGAINDALVDGIGSPASDSVSFSYDETTGTITLIDTEGFKLDTTGVTALFGAEELTSSGDPREILLDAGFTDFAAAHTFDLVLGADGDGYPVTVELAANAARTTEALFAAAINTALQALSVSRDVLADIAGPVLEVAVSQLVKAETIAGGGLRLVETNFADALGYEARDFAVRGFDVSDEIYLQIQSVGESNLASVLGFGEVEGEKLQGKITSEVLYEDTGIGAPRVYLDTDRSAVFAEISAGVESSLNITIGIGPLEVNVVNGTALLTNGKGSSDPALFGFSFIDVDGDAFDDQYDLRDLNALFNDADRSILDMIQMDVQVGILVDLPLSDSLGVFDPATDGIGYSADLLLSIDDQPLGTFDIDQIETHFEGDLIALYNGEAVDPDNLELRLPDLAELFENFNYLAFLNDPRAVLAALDTILNQMQSLFDNYLADIELPVIGDKIGAGVTFFDDFRYSVLEQIRIKAETPDPVTGKLPTTVDLLTNEVNILMNDLFETSGVVYMQARLDTSGSTSESYLLASLNFNGIIFDEDLAVDFEFGVPGLDLEVTDGSKLRMTLDYLVNIGFGIDKNGFFLLNDTDEAEVGITFTVDAGTFEGSAEVLGVLGLEASAVTLDDDGNVTSTTDGVAYVSATLGAQLFGDDEGLVIIDSGDAGDDEIVRDFGDIDLADALGNELTFERLIYFNQIDYGSLINFSFTADFEINIALTGSVLDPTTGGPIRIGGVAILPTVATEFWVEGSYSYGDGLNIDQLSFENVRLNMQELYEAVLKPILDPIMEVVNPLADFFRWTQETPFKEALSVAAAAFPIIGIANTVVTIGLQVTDMINLLSATGGILIFGDYDFTPKANAIVSGETTMSESSSSVSVTRTSRSSATNGTGGNPFGVFGNIQQGISIEVPLLSQPSNILDLILGNYDQVDLAIVHMNLFNFDTGKIDLVDEILSSVGIPGWVGSVVERFFQAEISLKFKAGFSAGYDLGGIVNFVNTLDPERLLDGVFIDSAPGSLVNAEVWGRFALNAGIAGASGEVGAGVKLSFNDPNQDGKLRIPEIIALVEAAADALADGDIGEALGLIFVGEAYYKAKLSIWAGINLPWPLPDLKWSTTVFDIGDTINFGGNPVPARMVTDQEAGQTAFLNIGARGGDSMTKITGDGNDQLVLTGGGSGNYNAAYSQGAKSFNGSFANNSSAIVMQAGEGNNTLNLSGASGTLPTVSYTGSGTDTIILPTSGLHVVFAGEGNDTIKTNSASTGTYIIFGQAGSDTIDIQGGNVIYFGDDDFGARDLFQATFASDAVTEAEIRAFFGINADGTPNASVTQKNFTSNGTSMNLDELLECLTTETQLSATKAADKITLGSGNHVVLTGSGADQIKVNGAAGIGTMTILSGDGSDQVEVTNAATVLVEAGGGGDRVIVNATSSTIWGYAAKGGVDGIPDDASADLRALLIGDSMDILIGGAGADLIHGQLGSDFIEGGNGADTMTGGIGDDILVGGKMVLADKSGTAITLRDLVPNSPLQKGLLISVENGADGNDVITGSNGLDVIIGGGGSDTLRGNSGGDVILGDFGKVLLSSNLVAQEVSTLFDSSANNGTDVIEGGVGGDVLIAGGGITGQTESVTDLEGSNVVLGDFGQAKGARLLDAAELVESFASASGSSDSITTGRGNDILIGGEGNDTLRSGIGGDIVIGDLGRVNPGNALVESMASSASGADSISTDTDDNVFDLVIGGGGSDTITGGLGGMVVLGDDGTLDLDSIALSLLQSYEAPSDTATAEDLEKDAEIRARIAQLGKEIEGVVDASSGNDVVTITGGALIAVLGGGDDAASNSGAADFVYLLGDNGKITIETTVVATVSTTEVSLVSAKDATDGDDTITTGTGNDWIIAGGANDSVDGGTGDNVILGDHGSYDGTTLTSVPTDVDGSDTITTGLGRDLIIAGGAGDSVSAGDGENVILGDYGSFDGVDLISALTGDDGNDSVTSGSGNDWVILGQGDDTADLGNGNNRVLGDSGTIDATVVTSTENAEGGQDSITTGTGNDIVIAGSGNDTVDGGDGNNFVLGDAGTRNDTAGTLTSERTLGDGVDDLTTGTGDDWVFGGGNTDLIDAGNGNNVVLGDSGTHNGTLLNSVRTDGDASDTITTGTGNDMIIAGGDADSVTAGDGENVIAGDSGSFDGLELISALNAGDGNDTVYAGSGNDWVILGQGDETADLGNGNNRVLGDSGKITATIVTSSENDKGGNDSITTGTGNDIVIAGSGNDTVDGGNGNNFVLGDAGTRNDTAGTLTSERTLGDGVDDLTTGTGDDWVFGGGNTDLIDAGDGNNVVLGDSGTHNGTLLNSVRTVGDASDTITTGTGNDMIIAGGDADSVTAGDGENVIASDSGSFDGLELISALNEGDGNDTVYAGSGNDWVILGQGDETADLGNGNNRVLGDSGRITATIVTSTENDKGGQDSITTGAGNDIVIAGSGNDTVDGGDGNNFVLGDAGTRNDTAGTLTSERTVGDGVDDLTTGTGDDWVFGGGNTDSITAGEGDNRILGDSGSFDENDLISALNEGDANDTVTSGSGNDWVILGQGDDTANLGGGDNQVLGDSGLIRELQAYSTQNANGGKDSITTGIGNDVIIAGSGNDTVAASDGENIILGDAGTLDREGWSLTSELTSGDGNDSVTSGSGDDWAILGQGDDFADLGGGNNRAIGDSGVIVDDKDLTLDTTSNLNGGKDTIQTGDGDDILLGGANSDLIYGGNGDNTALGDNGNVTYDATVTTGMTSVTTEISTAGAPDTIETGDGRDVIVGGEGGDRILSGAGADLVMGDQGSVTGSNSDMFGTLTSLINEVPGDDYIELGAGNDVAIAGLGNDSVYAGQGEDMVLGDSGHIKFSNLSDIEEILLEDQDRGGNDFITAAGVGGDNILVGQFGSDTIEGGTDDDVILGDFATFNFRPGEDGFNGMSSADRMQKMTAIRVDLSFNDSLVGDTGSDFMMGGMGDDLMYGNDGQDIMIGDMVIFERFWTAEAGVVVFEETTLDTNFAYVTGGYDEFYSGEGPDIMIGGLGPDLFFGNTEFDLIYSDAYAGLFNATWTDGFTGATPQRFLIKSNFAGPGAIDVVSESQQDTSIGGPLDLRADGMGYNPGDEAAAADRLLAILGTGGIPQMAYLVIDILGSYDVVEAISALVAGGLDADILVDALRNEVIGKLLSMDLQGLVVTEIMIERIIRLYLVQAGLLPEAAPVEGDAQSNGSASAALPWKIAAE